MSGGIAYVLDEGNILYRNLNKQLVSMEQLTEKTDIEDLRKMIEKHVEATGSVKGQKILDNYEEYIPHFKKIIPVDYKEILRLIGLETEKGADLETARIEAFKAFVGGEA